jgi:hypothetical protein
MMPAFGYDYMMNGAVTPFTMSSILGGALSLLPNPDKEGWLTWGFDPFSAGEDAYQQTAEISTGAAIMRVPTKYINGDDDSGFSDYLARAAATCHETLQTFIGGLDVESVKEPTFALRISQAVTQLGNVMTAIDILNRALTSQGIEPLRPQFGTRYKARAVNLGGEVITQATITDYVVYDLWNDKIADSGYPDMDLAVHAARVMNDKSRDKWVKQQIDTIVLPDWVTSLQTAKIIKNPINDIQNYLIAHGFGMGDLLTEARLYDTINYLWRRPRLLLSDSSVYFSGILPDGDPTTEDAPPPQPVDTSLQIAYATKNDEAFFGAMSLAVTTDQPWLTAEIDEEYTITVTADITQVNDAGLYNGVVTITEANNKVVNNNVTLPVTFSVADPTVVPALPDAPPVIEPQPPVAPPSDTAPEPTPEPVAGPAMFAAPPLPDFTQEVEQPDDADYEEGEID